MAARHGERELRRHAGSEIRAANILKALRKLEARGTLETARRLRAAYARGEFWEERVRMAQWWAGLLSKLKNQRAVS